MRIPDKLSSGDSITWKDDASRDNLGNAVTSGDWALAYYIRGAQALTVNSVASGNGWQTTITAAQSGALAAGLYYWQAVASKGDDRITLGSGQITVLANLAYTGSPTAYDGRSEAEQILDAINTEIKARLQGGATIEYSIGNRSLRKEPMSELLALQARYRTIVVRQRQAQSIANGLGNPRSLYVRF